MAFNNYDWSDIGARLDARGFAVLTDLLAPADCKSISAGFEDGGLYRAHIHMHRYGFGEGEYKYFAYPLPDLIAKLRQDIYPRLAPIANEWSKNLALETLFPSRHGGFIDQCRQAGQTRPTPLLLRYRPGDYNRLHQDIYGELSFPIQLAVQLDRPGQDFEGGEFVLTEQKPRSQSRAHVVGLNQGDAVLFAVSERPAKGARGYYRLKMRHGVSELRSGERHTLGIIFHDAA